MLIFHRFWGHFERAWGTVFGTLDIIFRVLFYKRSSATDTTGLPPTLWDGRAATQMDPNWKTKAFFKGLKPASQQKLTFLKDLGFCILAQELHTSLKYKGGCNFTFSKEMSKMYLGHCVLSIVYVPILRAVFGIRCGWTLCNSFPNIALACLVWSVLHASE